MPTDDTSSVGMVVMSTEDARRAIESGNVPDRLRVDGELRFYAQSNVTLCRALPAEELVADVIIINDASALTHWPRVVRCRVLFLERFHLDFAPNTVIEIGDFVGASHGYGGRLELNGCSHVTNLPVVSSIAPFAVHLRNCPRLLSLPADLRVTTLEVIRCPELSHLPVKLQASSVTLSDCTGLRALPDDFIISGALNLHNCIQLTRLPESVEAQRFTVTDCRSLTALPRRVRSLYVALDHCSNLTSWDDPEVTSLRMLSARGCLMLKSLPPNLRQIDELDVSGCQSLTSLPAELQVRRWVDVGASGLRALPPSAQGVQVRWNGVTVTGQIAFHPETLTARQALSAENAELRRVMLERIGPERFFAEAQPEELDADMDSGGKRRLLRVVIPGDEALVMLQVRDPSTGRVYLLRVPPSMKSCRSAASWIAGFSDPNNYRPVMET